jgi:hypothetical protein
MIVNIVQLQLKLSSVSGQVYLTKYLLKMIPKINCTDMWRVPQVPELKPGSSMTRGDEYPNPRDGFSTSILTGLPAMTHG